MQYTKDTHGIVYDPIRHDVLRVTNNQFSRAVDTTRTATFGELNQHQDLRSDTFIDGNGRAWAVLFDEVENAVPVFKCK